MAMEHQIKPPAGMRRSHRRVGRGDGSGRGNRSGRGQKGQGARAGKGPRPGFEGGQIPLIKRLPSVRGFVNIFRVDYAEVKVGQLDRFDAGSEVTPQQMVQTGILRDPKRPVKVLADGDLTKPLTVRANKFSAAARAKIEAAGGKVEEVV